MLRALCHSDAGWSTVEDVSTLSELRARAGNLLWAEAEISELRPEDVAKLAEELALHPLAVEDALNPRQRPKLEHYGDHTFAVMHQLDDMGGQLEATQIACFIGDRFVLVLHADAQRTLRVARRRWEQHTGEGHEVGPPRLVHTILDVIVDDYQAFADDLEDHIEDIEERVLENPEVPVQRELYSLKQRLARLRRYAVPGARVLDWLVAPGAAKAYSEETTSMFRDVHDHLMRINDQIRNVEALADAVLDLRVSYQTSRLNEINKRLTAWAAVIAVPTFLASLYGMNFDLAPAGGTRRGFWFAIAFMAVVAVALYANFRRRNWL